MTDVTFRSAVGSELPVALYQRVFEQSPLGMLVYRWDDPPNLGAFRLLAQNEAAIRAGAIREDLGKRFDELASRALLESEVPGRYGDCLTRNQPVTWELDWTQQSGKIVHYDVQCFPIDERHVVVFFADMTERSVAQRELAVRMQELQRSNRQLDDFAYVASHDLKSPLRDIHNLATWIAEDLGNDLPDDTARHVRVLTERIARMERLLDDLLSYSRAGRESRARERVSVRAVVKEVVALLQPKGHEVEVEGPIDEVFASRVGVTVVLRNLISNSIKHDDRQSGRIVVTVAPHTDGVAISVSDEGPGIPPQFHERVFRLFQTLRPRDATDSTGIGLAIVKKIVESERGRVEVDSVARGTTIRTIWPSSTEDAP